MQQGSFEPVQQRHDSEGLVGRLNALGAAVRDAGGVVIFVQHDGPVGDPHHPDAPGSRLRKCADPASSVVTVRLSAPRLSSTDAPGIRPPVVSVTAIDNCAGVSV